MIKFLLHRICFIILFCVFPSVLLAQEKTDLYYYNGHADEILPDAQTSFQNGEYERTIDLCKCYFVYFGNNTAESLQKKAEQCAHLAKDMDALYAEGKRDEALEAANNLLSINPDDPKAKS